MRLSPATTRAVLALAEQVTAARPVEPIASRVEVPVPPSTNNLFATGTSRRRFVSPEYKAWRAEVYPLLQAMRRPAAFPVEVWLTLCGKGVSQRRDIGNIEKALGDALVACGVLPDDSLKYVWGCHQVYRPDSGAQRVRVEVLPVEGV